MISTLSWLDWVFIVASVLWIAVIVGRLGLRRVAKFHTGGFSPEEPPLTPPNVLFASNLAHRQTIGAVLRDKVRGDFDYRDGQVYKPVPDELIHPVIANVNNAIAGLERTKNPAACSLYFRDSVSDRFMLLPDLDIDDLRDIRELLRAAVAERQRKAQK